MREITSTVTSKGQVTIPAEIRKLLKIEKDSKITFVIEDDQTVRVRAAEYPDVESLVGTATSKNPSLPWDKVREIARSEALQEKMRRSE